MTRMLTFRRALVAAAFLLILLFLFTRTHSQPEDESAPSKDVKSQQTMPDTKAKTPEDAAIRNGYGASTAYSTSSSTKVTTSGSKTPAKNQQPMENTSHMSLIDKLAYQFPYDVETKFPAYIWQTWKYTPASGEFAENFRGAEASWS